VLLEIDQLLVARTSGLFGDPTSNDPRGRREIDSRTALFAGAPVALRHSSEREPELGRAQVIG
jgi:hypothetical protein